ncbi:M48 family metallopeptidase [Rhodovastum atsumiense]|uniref:M48 family metallopeptidase n=1 Tax=Rhodovastum atsumiense TaxID=504468 RepID=A0A5M6IT49_9PROT|nr:M48 family metallopeptidase [Rhodovastum atsumiense]KAA5611079.1 M48 family metallopeptidase [Rhodovastum atsumiense]CAH2599139.1 M48 family metallopeptidase [Rhodovastum atsumiense]
MCFFCFRGFTRRNLLGLATLAALPGCDDGLPVNLVSEATVRKLGLETWSRMRAQIPASTDASRQQLLGRVADRLLTAAGENADAWDIVLFARPDINAFALPGKRIGVFEGLFRVAVSPDQLAAVIGHEIGHVQANHAQERMNVAVAKDLGLKAIAAALNLTELRYANQIAAIMGAGVELGLLLPYSRRQELEADRLGLVSMARAEFDPGAAITLWRRMDQMVPRTGPTFLATHPAPAQRIAALEDMLKRIDRPPP